MAADFDKVLSNSEPNIAIWLFFLLLVDLIDTVDEGVAVLVVTVDASFDLLNVNGFAMISI